MDNNDEKKSAINSEKKSAVILRVCINGHDRNFYFEELANIGLIKEYIIKEAERYGFTVDRDKTYYVGNKMINITEEYDNARTIDNYLKFLQNRYNGEKRK